jgi:trigger factor
LQLDAPPPEESKETKQKLNLGVQIEQIGACERHVTVSIPREDIDRYFKRQFDDISPRAEVPGFRPGKAPRKLLEAKFQRQVAEQVKGALLMDSLSQLTEDQSFAAISEPDLNYELVKIPDQGPMIFEFNIEVRPEFDLPQWKGLSLKKFSTEATDELLDHFLRRSLLGQGELEDTNAPAKSGDYVTLRARLTYEGKDVPSIDEFQAQVKKELVFNDATVDNFDAAIAGKNIGDKFVVKASVSEFADADKYQGKTMEVELEVLKIQVRGESESMDPEKMKTYRESMRGYIESRFEYEQQQELRSQILVALTKDAKWELPKDLLKRQFRREISRATMEMRASGLDDSDIAARESELRRDAMEHTKRLLQEHFILERIAEEEKVVDTDQDYHEEITRIAQSSRETERRVRAKLERTGQMDALRNMIIERKVIDLIQEHANIEVKPRPLPPESTHSHVGQSLIVESGENIPEAKYEDQQMPKIPGVDKTATRPS